MSLEIILWFVTWFVLSEIVFIARYIMDDRDWILTKVESFIGAALVMAIHLVIGMMGNDCSFLTETCARINYSMYLYELYVVVGIAMLFGINKLVTMGIDKWQD